MSEALIGARNALRLPATLLVAGQLAYIAVTQFHAGGHANDHHEIFETYAHDALWGGVHLGQFVAMAILVAGLLALASLLASRDGWTLWLGRLGAASAVTALALYGVLQAVDGVALKQAVIAWAGAPAAEQSARFASAETVRWLEWGMRSYEDFAIGIALALFAGAITTNQGFPRGLGLIAGFSGVAYLAQGWIAGAEGFSSAQSVAIVLGWSLCLVWMTWLAIWAWLPFPPGKRSAARVDRVRLAKS